MSSAPSESGVRRTDRPDARWFATAGLGLLVRWGISSVHGGIELSWGMVAGTPWDAAMRDSTKITPRRYFALAERFSPSRYDPLRWLEAARRAGFRYAVMTAKHHDGYLMWPSPTGEFGVRAHLGGRDLVTPFVQACRRVGLKVGLSYSPLDWHFNRAFMSFHYGSDDRARFPGRPHLGLDHETLQSVPAPPEEHTRAYHVRVRGHLKEILSGFGKLDILWIDGPPELIDIDEIRRLQPGIVVNSRMRGVGDCLGVDRMPDSRPDGCWELCDSLQEGAGWGYRADAPYRSAGWLLGRLARVRAWGGNELLAVGPGPDGELPPQYYERMEELESWMEHSGGSLFGVDPDPSGGPCGLPVTAGSDTWYVHLPPSHVGAVRLDVPRVPRAVTLLRTGEPVQWAMKRHDGPAGSAGKLVFEVPASSRTDLDDVVAVRL